MTITDAETKYLFSVMLEAKRPDVFGAALRHKLGAALFGANAEFVTAEDAPMMRFEAYREAQA